MKSLIACCILLLFISLEEAAPIFGVVTYSGSVPFENARITLLEYRQTLIFVDELRTDAQGRYNFTSESYAGRNYTIGVAALGMEYQEMNGVSSSELIPRNFQLASETNKGRWTNIGRTGYSYFPAGTPGASMLPMGSAIYCHSTLDPVLFDPKNPDDVFYVRNSTRSQGCFMNSIMLDGTLIYVGGQSPERPENFVDAIKEVKAYDYKTDTWQVYPDLNEERWYPSVIRLGGDVLLACGGGQRPNAARTKTCELYNPKTKQWRRTGSMLNGTEYAPSVLLFSGKVLLTHSPPQLFDMDTETWQATGNFVQPNRKWPGHSPHYIFNLESGDVVVIGNYAENSGPGNAPASMVEKYNSLTGTWSLGTSPQSLRSLLGGALQLPDGNIFCAGGKLEITYSGTPPETNEWGQVKTTNLYNPITDKWREMNDMLLAREYHAMALLTPDARVIITSGTGDQASSNAPENSVEAFEPPYLFRGIRPQIVSLSTDSLLRGSSVIILVTNTKTPTKVVLLGLTSYTHWVDGGVQRFVGIPFSQSSYNTSVIILNATLPSDANKLIQGWYYLFVLTDDVPSDARIVRILDTLVNTPAYVPTAVPSTQPNNPVSQSSNPIPVSESPSLHRVYDSILACISLFTVLSYLKLHSLL